MRSQPKGPGLQIFICYNKNRELKRNTSLKYTEHDLKVQPLVWAFNFITTWLRPWQQFTILGSQLLPQRTFKVRHIPATSDRWHILTSLQCRLHFNKLQTYDYLWNAQARRQKTTPATNGWLSGSQALSHCHLSV